MASPTRIGTDANGRTAASTSLTISITVPGTGNNRALIVMCGSEGSNSVPTGVTFGGVSMTQIYSQLGTQQSAGFMYYLANPAASTANIVISFSPAVAIWGVGATYQDIVQTSGTVVDVSGTANNAGSTSISKSVTTGTNSSIVLTFVVTSAIAASLAPTAPQSQIAAQNGGVVDTKSSASDTPQATAGAISTGFSWTGVAGNDLFVVALKYQAPTLVTTNVPFFLRMI